MNFIKSHWKLLLIAVGALILLLWIGSVTGTNRKLLNMALDQLRKDQTQTVTDLRETTDAQKSQILGLQQEIRNVMKQKAIVQARADKSDAEVARLTGRVNELQQILDRITVSNDPDAVIADLRRYGIRSIRVRVRNR